MSVAIPEFVQSLVVDGSKVGYWPDRVAAWRRGERIAPITIDCAMTRACQAACAFCYASLQANESGKITREQFFNFLNDAAEIGVKGVSFISDGESTVVPWYADAVEHAASLGLKVGAGSNGIKLTKPVLERVLPHLSYLRFNFSAGERKRYAEIMGLPQSAYDVVIQNIKDGMEIINRDKLGCVLNVQLVCNPKDADQLLPFARLVAELRPVYGIIKHCSDGSEGELGVDYSRYDELLPTLQECEEIGRRAGVRITVKWNRIKTKLKRGYTRCYGPPFQLQISGSGLVSTCGLRFNDKYATTHIGSICRDRFKNIWASDRYKEVMDYIASEHFNPQERCAPGCLQDPTNQYLFDLVEGKAELPTGPVPPQPEFI